MLQVKSPADGEPGQPGRCSPERGAAGLDTARSLRHAPSGTGDASPGGAPAVRSSQSPSLARLAARPGLLPPPPGTAGRGTPAGTGARGPRSGRRRLPALPPVGVASEEEPVEVLLQPALEAQLQHVAAPGAEPAAQLQHGHLARLVLP